MDEALLLGVAGIIVLGIAAQWVADRLRLPSILLLLLGGFVAGPVLGLLDPDALIGEVLPALVSLAVGIILFDGGLSLRFTEIREVRVVVRRLITVGALVTIAVATLAARFLLDFDWRLSLLLASILVVSGPTVVLPLLRHIRPSARLGSAIKWEGIFIDPIGAVLAVLVFEVILVGAEGQHFTLAVLLGLLVTGAVGALVGVAAAWLLVSALKHYLVAHHLEIPVTVGMVVLAFAGSNLVRPESGLLATTIMGVAMANQRSVPVRHIVEFGETVGVLLTSVLFVVLAARLELADFAGLGWSILVYLAILVLVARPLAAALSTAGSEMRWQERVVVGWMAPRGIVAASVASVFALRLSDAGVAKAELLVPYVFSVIVGTALVYGLTAAPLARALGVADPDPQGIVLVGAHAWARRIGETLSAAGFRVLMIPTNRHDLAAARLQGLAVHPGSILEEDALEHVRLEGIGWMVAMTQNEEFNSLAALRFIDRLGRKHVFQLPADREPGTDREVTHELRGRLAFGDDATFHAISQRFADGAVVKRTKLSEEFGFDDFCATYDGSVLPLFRIRDGQLHVVSQDDLDARPGDLVVSVVPGPDVEATRRQAAAEQDERREAASRVAQETADGH